MALDPAPTRRVLMCPPTHFDVRYAINPWMDPSLPVDRDRAQRQWYALVETLRAAQVHIELLEPASELPDIVFTANLGLVDGCTFVPARMRHRERQPESRRAEPWFRARGFRVRGLGDEVVQEGAGDALPFGDVLVAGYGPRSSARSHVELGQILGLRIVPLELVDERFYHLDVVFSPLDARSALIVPSALGRDAARRVAELVDDPIWLTAGEAEAFCANAIVVGRTLIMPACTPRLERELHARGFEPVVVDVSEFLKAGGGPRCLTLALDVELSGSGCASTSSAGQPPPACVSRRAGTTSP